MKPLTHHWCVGIFRWADRAPNWPLWASGSNSAPASSAIRYRNRGEGPGPGRVHRL